MEPVVRSACASTKGAINRGTSVKHNHMPLAFTAPSASSVSKHVVHPHRSGGFGFGFGFAAGSLSSIGRYSAEVDFENLLHVGKKGDFNSNTSKSKIHEGSPSPSVVICQHANTNAAAVLRLSVRAAAHALRTGVVRKVLVTQPAVGAAFHARRLTEALEDV